MAAGHFHVHGPHDHEVEHARAAHAQHATHESHQDAGELDSGMNQRVALMTAVFAVLGAVSSWQGGESLADAMFAKNESILLKNQSVLKKTEAANQWSYYQAKSGKQNLAELGLALAPVEKQSTYREEVERYRREKAEIQAQAEALEAEVKKFDRLSDEANAKALQFIHPHHRWEQAMTLFNIAIALSAITIITKRRWLFRVSLGAGALGIVWGLMALAHI